MSIWALLYCIPLVFLTGFAFGKKDRDIIIITSISIVALIFTRLISGYVEGGSHMFDMANDMMVVAIMLMFIGFKPIVLLLIATYGCMTMFAYLPYLEGSITKQDYHVILEIVGQFQLLIIFEGLNGYFARIRSKLAYVFSYVGGVSGVRSNFSNESKRDNGPSKTGTCEYLAKDN